MNPETNMRTITKGSTPENEMALSTEWVNCLAVLLQCRQCANPTDLHRCWMFVVQILVNFLQVTGVAVTVNVDWTKFVKHVLACAGQ